MDAGASGGRRVGVPYLIEEVGAVDGGPEELAALDAQDGLEVLAHLRGFTYEHAGNGMWVISVPCAISILAYRRA